MTKSINNINDTYIIRDINKTSKKHIKMKNTYLVGEKRDCNKEEVKCKYRQDNPKKIQRFLRKEFNKQVKTDRRINKEVYGGKEIMTRNKIIDFLKILKFKPKNGSENEYHKMYDNSYEIVINLNEENILSSKVNYGKKIKVHRGTTNNFLQEENFVVLECINRLLEKGYNPESIELEKVWNLGHKGKGFLDILVKDKSNKSFLMIECKNWGNEYEKEKKNTLDKSKYGSQIFSYLQQDPKNTKAICLYTSKIDNSNIEYKNSIIYNKEEWANLNQEERFSRWSETFEENGIFESWVNPYFLNTKSITKGQLKKLTKDDGENIYNKFAEILRHNVISDKSNAFNKIINLFLCKIYDEDREESEEVKFQIRTKTRLKEDEELLSDLADLYKQGMIQYLNKNIVDYTLEELQDKIKTKDDNILLDVYKKLRLYKDNDFAFREVFDEKSFKDNAKVVREVVELLQDKQIRYSHKQQFLGEFFENLLKDSIKQESGQFFTPVPITQFIIKSLPINELIQNKIHNNEDKILPYVIDYACGAGHFLTEIMDELNGIIQKINVDKIQKPSVKKQIKNWQTDDFMWADEYVYGIDLDYRLVKTSKISCFLNGDGLAQVIHADGLDNFKLSEIYQGILKSKSESKDNKNFEILISNPPYSVKAFRNTLNEGEKSFELYDKITDDSKEIECLFIERAKQLLKEDGIIGLVLPISVLTNGGIYEKTREIIFKNFNIKSIVSLGSNAFMATGTKTIILFMQRKNENEFSQIVTFVDSFLTNYKDITINNIEKPIYNYVKENYNDIDFNDYITLLKDTPNEKLKKSNLWSDCRDLTNEQVKKIEKEKICYFISCYPQKVIFANSGEKDIEKEFYGYEFSDRRGHEGIHPYKDEDGNIISKLYNPLDNRDSRKLNYYILMNYKNEIKELEKDIDTIKKSDNHPLKEHINFLRLSDLMTFDSINFDKSINLNIKKKRIDLVSKYSLVKMGDILDTLESGKRDNKVGSLKIKKGIPSLGGEHIGRNGELVLKNMKFVTEEFYKKSKLGKIRKKDILLCKDGALTGKVAIVDSSYSFKDSMVNEHLFIIRGNKDKINQDYLFNFLYSYEGQSILNSNIQGSGQGGISKEGIYKIKLPLPPLEIQKKIIEEINEIEKEENNFKSILNEKRNKIEGIIENINSKNKIKIVDISHVVTKGTTPTSVGFKFQKEGINFVKIESIDDYGNIKTDKLAHISKEGNEKLKRSQLKEGDILFSIAGSFGRVAIVNRDILPANTNQALSIIKLNKSKILPKYLFYLLKSKNIVNQTNKLIKGIAQFNLSLVQVSNLEIPEIDIKEQEKVINQIEPLEKEIEKKENYLETSKKLKQKVLDKYLK